jgi:hypothetical protein
MAQVDATAACFIARRQVAPHCEHCISRMLGHPLGLEVRLILLNILSEKSHNKLLARLPGEIGS